MKLKFLVLLIILANAVKGQYTPQKAYGYQYNRLKPLVVLHLPVLPDTSGLHTTDTSAQFGLYNGTLYYHYGHWRSISAAGGAGSVTSVGLSLPSEFNVSGSPVTTSGTLTGAWANQTQYKLFGRGSGTGTPSFLSSIDSNWIPALHSQGYYDGRYYPLSSNPASYITLADIPDQKFGKGDLTANEDRNFQLNNHILDIQSVDQQSELISTNQILRLGNDGDKTINISSLYQNNRDPIINTAEQLIRSSSSGASIGLRVESSIVGGTGTYNFEAGGLSMSNASGSFTFDKESSSSGIAFQDGLITRYGDGTDIEDGDILLGETDNNSFVRSNISAAKFGVGDNIATDNRRFGLDLKNFVIDSANEYYINTWSPSDPDHGLISQNIGSLTLIQGSSSINSTSSDGSAQVYASNAGMASLIAFKVATNKYSSVKAISDSISFTLYNSDNFVNTKLGLYNGSIYASHRYSSTHDSIAVWNGDTLRSYPFPTGLAPTGAASGDLSGSYPGPTVVWANGYTTYDARYPLRSNNLSDLSSASAARTNLGLAIGTNVQAYNADLAAIAALTPSNDDILQRKAGAWTNRSISQLKTDLSLSGTNTGDQTITLTGDVTGSGTGSFAATIGAGKVTNSMLAGSIAASKFVGTDITTVGTIGTGTWQASVIGSSYGGAGTVNGLLKANGSGTVSAAAAGTDYLSPSGSGTGLSGVALLGTANTFTTSGANSAASQGYSGAVYTGGTGATTVPFITHQPTGTSNASIWSTSGTVYGMNEASGFSGNFVDYLVNNSRKFNVTSAGSVVAAGGGTFSAAVSSGVSLSVTQNNFGTSSTDGLVLNNTTSGTAGIPVQYSQRARYIGAAYTGSASQTVYLYNELRPVNGTNPVTGNFVWVYNVNAAGDNVRMTLTDDGKLGVNTSPTSTLHSGGSFAATYTASAVDITLTASHYTINLTATGKTATLPTAVGVAGRMYVVKLTASGTGTVATTSSQTIDGSTTYSLSAQYKYVTVQSDGANWIVIANN